MKRQKRRAKLVDVAEVGKLLDFEFDLNSADFEFDPAGLAWLDWLDRVDWDLDLLGNAYTGNETKGKTNDGD